MAEAIDWDAVHVEALDILVRYLSIDSSNPPGREAEAARFLGALCEAEGIECRYLEPAPERDLLYARIPGDGSKRPFMLCNHTDVVPVEADQWTVPPFEGFMRDRMVFGRGAVDMKGPAVMQLIAFLLAKRRVLALKSDLIFCAVADEEAAGRYGMEWLCDHHPELVDVEFELNEGGGGFSGFAGIDRGVFAVATNEKQICWLRLRAVGTPGHGSMPHEDNSSLHLMRALLRLADWDRGITYTAETRMLLERLVDEGVLAAAEGAQTEALLRMVPQLHAMFVNTLNVTMLDAGIKANVIPAQSEAVIDCRLLPGQDREQWRRQVVERIDDPRVEVTFHEQIDSFAPTAVGWDTELYRTIESVMRDAVEDALVVPYMTVGGTDNRFLRARGIPAYGFIPCLLSPEEWAGFHGNDEFITIENLNMGCELMYEIVSRMCT